VKRHRAPFEFAAAGGGGIPFSQSSLAARESQASRMRRSRARSGMDCAHPASLSQALALPRNTFA
jgi:hypothetical protein